MEELQWERRRGLVNVLQEQFAGKKEIMVGHKHVLC
jgi:hypothetical protein